MKKSPIKILIVFFFALSLAGCEKDYENVSTIARVPHLELNGNDPLIVVKGEAFVDPGIYAEEYVNGDTIKDLDYKVLGSINTDIGGAVYKLTYEVENSEGVAFYKDRTVAILEGFDVFEIPQGEYDGIRVSKGVGAVVTITKVAPGIYSVSDLMGGYYIQRYDETAAAPGLFVINEAGEIRSEVGYASAFGSDVTASDIIFDAESGVFSFYGNLDAHDFGFDVKMTKK